MPCAAEAHRPACDECVEACAAVRCCQQCARNLCRECSDHHRRSRATAGHRLLAQPRGPGRHTAAICPSHREEQLEFFCETCGVVCCRACLVQDHEAHTYKLSAGGLVQARLGQVRALVRKFQERHQGVSETMQYFEREVEAARTHAEDAEARVRQAMEERRQAYLLDLAALADAHREAVQQRRAALSSVMVALWGAIGFVEEGQGDLDEALQAATKLAQASRGAGGSDAISAAKAAPMSLGQAGGDGAAAVPASASLADPSCDGTESASGGSSLEQGQLHPRARRPPHRSRQGPATVVSLAAELQKAGAGGAARVSGSCGDARAAGGGAGDAGPATRGPPPEGAPASDVAVRPGGPASPSVGRGPRQISLLQAIGPAGAARPAASEALGLIRRFQQVSDVEQARGVHARSDEELAKAGIGRRKAILGHEGELPGSFRSPCGMAIDSGHIYIADTLNHRIQVFDRTSRALLGQVALPKECEVEELLDPSGLCCTGDGRLVVVQYGLDRLLNIQLSAGSMEALCVQSLAAEKQLYGPFGVGFTLGRIIVADSCNHRCLVLGTSGEVLFEFGGRGREPGQFEYPECVATFSDGHVAVSDKDNQRIQVFDADGKFCHFIPSHWQPDRGRTGVAPPGALQGPMGIVADRRDRLYVCDCSSNRIQIFTRQGRWLWSSDAAGDEAPELAAAQADVWFDSPTGIAIDETGTVYVASDHCVQIF